MQSQTRELNEGYKCNKRFNLIGENEEMRMIMYPRKYAASVARPKKESKKSQFLHSYHLLQIINRILEETHQPIRLLPREPHTMRHRCMYGRSSGKFYFEMLISKPSILPTSWVTSSQPQHPVFMKQRTSS